VRCGSSVIPPKSPSQRVRGFGGIADERLPRVLRRVGAWNASFDDCTGTSGARAQRRHRRRRPIRAAIDAGGVTGPVRGAVRQDLARTGPLPA